MIEPIELRFRWDAAEHRRFYRTLRAEVLRRSKYRWLALSFAAFAVLLALWDAAAAPGVGVHKLLTASPYVILLAFWIALYQWGLPALSARAYQRNHDCIDADQVRRLTAEGIEAHCTSSDTRVRWSGVVRALETPEFLLLFTSPRCAIQLPKRSLNGPGELNHARALVRAMLGQRAEVMPDDPALEAKAG